MSTPICWASAEKRPVRGKMARPGALVAMSGFCSSDPFLQKPSDVDDGCLRLLLGTKPDGTNGL